MDQQRRTRKDRKHPRVPIKTYKWEDIRRARRRGGYPWTHLYKQPFNEPIDPDQFKMSSIRKTKSFSVADKSERIQISDVTENEEEYEKMDSLQIVTEPDDASIKNSISSVLIEECDTSDIGELDAQKPGNIGLESADSSDNISQYLDRDDRAPDKELELKKDDVDIEEKENINQEEQPTRKRKMSAESSYSKISLTKQALLQKIKDTKNKIKVPKLTFPIRKLKKPVPKSAKTVSSELKKEAKKEMKEAKKEIKKPTHIPPKDKKPVYIHIPLKPPPGQTDEFSYLEFEDKPPTESQAIKGVGSFKLLAKNIKRLQEARPTEDVLDKEVPRTTEKSEIVLDTQDRSLADKNSNENLKTANDIDTIENEEEKQTISIADKKTEEELIIDSNSNNIEITEEEQGPDHSITDQKSEANLGKNIGIEDKEENILIDTKVQLPESTVETDEKSENNYEVNINIRKGTKDKKSILKKSPPDVEEDTNQESQKGVLKKERAKSEEPERKRKLSLESSYSRKSLSKLEIMKKLKATSERIKKTFSVTNIFNKKKAPPESEETVAEKKCNIKKSEKVAKTEPVKPVYIHIPLKVPEEEQQTPQDEGSEPSNSPDSPDPTGVQFIILTAPSDDEILDYHSSDVPETPSDNTTFFDKIYELKQIAKEAVDDVTPPTSSHTLDPVQEETLNGNKIEKDSNSNTSTQNEDKKEVENASVSSKADGIKIKESENITIDVEDGLSESYKQTIQEKADHIDLNNGKENKSEEITLDPENMPVIKKKVSFKRRSKTPKDDSYEYIEPKTASNFLVEHEGQTDMKHIIPISDVPYVVDEKEIRLDTTGTVSPNEDEDKWSKISDHEYEPINPPPEVQVFSSIPTLNVTEDASNLHPSDRYPEIVNIISDVPSDDSALHNVDYPSLTRNEKISNIHKQPANESQTSQSSTDKTRDPNKFQLAWQQTTNQFKNKFRNMKKPQATESDKPKGRKFKFEKPKFNLPKIPNKSKINLPSLPTFNLPRRNSAKRTLKERQQSTESNAGDSKKITFGFSTYPRVFRKKTKPKDEQKREELDLASVTRPRIQETKSWSGGDIIRVPLHSEESISDEKLESFNKPEVQKDDDNNEYLDEDRMESHIRYKDDIDIDDECEEINNDEYLDRWKHGNFNADLEADYRKQFENSRYEVTDLDYPEDMDRQEFDYNSNQNKETERFSSGSSFEGHRVAGVLEEINPDEFFLRQKGISQDDIEVGMYLSSEIKEAFRTPENALSKLQHRDFNLNDSNQSLPEAPNKRRSMKKPKRKKTPHVSQERVYPVESDDEDLDFTPPSRPRRRSKRISKSKRLEEIIPYQETIPVETNHSTEDLVERDNVNMDRHERNPETNNAEQDIERRHNEYNLAGKDDLNLKYVDDNRIEKPAAPPRKHKSLKSLTSENDSILEEISSQIQTPRVDMERNLTDPDLTLVTYPIERPSRKKSRTSLKSAELPQHNKDEDFSSSSGQFFPSENQTPCVEEPCVQDIRDYMGYAIIDKQKIRDPPLPPPRPPNRKKRSTAETNFFTVPRQLRYNEAPVRPLRNYSTLGQAKKISEPATYENKENIDIIQYMEVDDEPNRDLQSGDIIKKMKDRPLPAPPRPPRKSRILQNITSKENIMADVNTEASNQSAVHDEPDDDKQSLQFENEKPTNVVSDNQGRTIEQRLITPDYFTHQETQRNHGRTIEQRLITPDYFTHQETITHGSLLVQSLDGENILRDSDLTSHSVERIIPISTEDDDETSSIPEDFKKLKDHPNEIEAQIQVPSEKCESESLKAQITSPVNNEVEVLKAYKLQVVDLDVDTLTVNKLLAGKIIVSEIDTHNIRADEIHSNTNETCPSKKKVDLTESAKISDSHVLDKSQISVDKSEVMNPLTNNAGEEKKTSTSENQLLAEAASDNKIIESMENQTDSFNEGINEYLQNDPPQPPPRSSVVNLQSSSEFSYRYVPQTDEAVMTTSNDEVMQEPDVDDEPPPRPPQPHLDYIPSQPPPSFYALRAQKYVDGAESNIPKIPRRTKRLPKSVSKSSSEELLVTPISRRFPNRSPEPSISQLSGQLIRTCGSTAHNALKRLITDITNNLKKNSDGKLDLHVMTIILLVLIAGLILLGYGEEKTVVHLHHWEYFNPPRDL